ncbi:hypothetical protein EAH89_07490 [Roseomonas nepalensis]|uniref:Uncharacterized protein n=1 Tax=Muricoccus nepalensis TaxID=1854500 RepID=A0A502GDR5_9PROT|nr:hypothetical protein [Roseomonas nepalensis]TPG59176.1 hypothetical protein EAH89_07490 [Roseomonas nepalensis]
MLLPPAPIVIFAFSRPDYLRRLCASLRAQEGFAVDGRQVHLLQDGARSPRSGVVYGDPAAIEAGIAVFREAFPEGSVHAAPHNLGVAMNIQRGEELVFRGLGAEIGYFFEEDLELGPRYLATLEAIRAQAAAHPRLGYFAAYGDHQAASDPDAPRLVPLEHHWGFGLTRRCWEAMQPWLRPFLEVYAEVDYQARPDLRIVGLYADKPVSHMASSQDVAKTMACADLGFARVNTDVCYARYIGARGESFRPADFASLGYDSMAYVTRAPKQPPAVTAAEIERIAREKRDACTAHRGDAYAQALEALGQRIGNPDRPVTRAEIDRLWWLLMDRLPEDEGYYAENVGRITLREVRRALLQSGEAQAKSFYMVP